MKIDMNFRTVILTGILLISAFLTFTAVGGEVALLGTTNTFNETLQTNWSGNGVFYNVEENTEGNIQILDTSNNTTQYNTSSQYDAGNGLYRVNNVSRDGTINLREITVETSDITSSTKATLYIYYYSEGAIVDSKEYNLEGGTEVLTSVGTNEPNATSYMFDVFLETDKKNQSPELVRLETDSAYFDSLVSSRVTGLLQLLLLLTVIGIAILYIAEQFS